MKARLLMLNHVVLFLCASMYLGTGGSLVLFSFPIAPQLTPDNYWLPFMPPVHAATEFFTPMTKLMIACNIVMLFSEWRNGVRWVPIVVLASVIAATLLTTQQIFPVNAEMDNHIQDPARLKIVLEHWMQLNRMRVALWCVQWAALAWWFARWSLRGRYPGWLK
ncbi:MAG: hypothetical protein HY021_09205 [Burkholderiales bacterium]|nr:hypothetical protein [Burkholderiales bacterium]